MSSEEKIELIKKVDLALDDIRPHLKVDGGDVEIVDITEDMQVMVKWLGNCEICSMSAMTMKAGLEQAVKQKVPSISSILAVNGIGVNE